MTVQEIKGLTKAGIDVYWKTTAYKVVYYPKSETWQIVYLNQNAIGLTHMDGITLNGNEEDFFYVLDESQKDFLACALWSSLDWSKVDDETIHNPEPMDENYGIEDFAIETLVKLFTFTSKFIEENEADYEEFSDEHGYSQFYHSLWLSMNGHGAGFFDFDGEYCERLQDKASGNEFDLYVGDDGKIYC